MRYQTPISERPVQAEIHDLWEAYRESGDRSPRDRLVLTFAPMVKSIAYRKLPELPEHVGVEELISSGLEALIRSLDRYDPGKGATLEQFLWTRICGAVVDELRRQDWAPRSLRTTERELVRARREFRAIHHREPTDEEASAAVGISGEKLGAHRLAVRTRSSIASLNVLVNDAELGSLELGDMLVSADGDPEAVAFAEVDKDALSAALAALTARERTVIGLVYFEEMTLAEAGEVIGVSESRVCQINGQARRRLHEHLAGGALALA